MQGQKNSLQQEYYELMLQNSAQKKTIESLRQQIIHLQQSQNSTQSTASMNSNFHQPTSIYESNLAKLQNENEKLKSQNLKFIKQIELLQKSIDANKEASSFYFFSKKPDVVQELTIINSELNQLLADERQEKNRFETENQSLKDTILKLQEDNNMLKSNLEAAKMDNMKLLNENTGG